MVWILSQNVPETKAANSQKLVFSLVDKGPDLLTKTCLLTSGQRPRLSPQAKDGFLCSHTCFPNLKRQNLQKLLFSLLNRQWYTPRKKGEKIFVQAKHLKSDIQMPIFRTHLRPDSISTRVRAKFPAKLILSRYPCLWSWRCYQISFSLGLFKVVIQIAMINW